ncbi:serine/threonine-protein kinase VRK2 isoform X2 [Lampris incognitus]|nr:serine/threonine-protein kinase VRK2 isoform X2 [Lampris incognitus]
MKNSNLDFLGIPAYWGSGLAEHNGTRYRFMAMDRLGSDLQKICKSIGGRLRKTAVLQLGLRLVDVLEYIHDNEYVHADIKAANVMLGYQDPEKVYLVDYGLSYRYCPDGVHKEYKENPKKGHNGTIEYTSLDAHNGVAPSRRGDLQILGFCLLHWLCGNLPWNSVLQNPTLVQEAKARLTDNLPGSVQQLSVSGVGTDEVARFLLYVRSLGYQERPDYQRLRELLAGRDLGKLDFSKPNEEHSGGTTASKTRSPSSGDKGMKPGPADKMAALSPKPKCRATTGGVRSTLYKGLHGDLPDLSVLQVTDVYKDFPVAEAPMICSMGISCDIPLVDSALGKVQAGSPLSYQQPATATRDLSSPTLKMTQARRSSKPRPAAKEEEEERGEDEMKEPLPASNERRSPRTKPQSKQVDPLKPPMAGKASSAVRKSSRTKPEPMGTDEEARPKPISKEYLWAPPIGHKPSKTRSLKKSDDCRATSAR